jgi:hypothetical protein
MIESGNVPTNPCWKYITQKPPGIASWSRFISETLPGWLAFNLFMRRVFLQDLLSSTAPAGGGAHVKESDKYRENAANCALLAQNAKHGPARIRFKRMETAWLCLADEQDWLDGEVSPASIPVIGGHLRKTPPV